MTNKLAEAIERVREGSYDSGCNTDQDRADINLVCDAAQRCVEVEYKLELTGLDRDLHKAAHLEARRERDRLQETLLARHGGEPLALLAELDEARAERDAYKSAKAENDERFMLERDEARATLAGIERLLRERLTLGYLPRLHWPDGREYMIWNTSRVLGTGTTLVAAVQAALAELDKETK